MKAVIFDLDGTLTDTLTAISHFGNLALTDNGFEPIEKNEYKYLVGNGRDILIHRMLAFHNADTEENYKKVGSVYDEYYEADPMYKTDAYDGIKEALTELKRRGIKLAVCTNKPDNVAQDVIKLVFGDGVFDFVCGVYEGGLPKPDPSRALVIAKKLGVKPEECIFIGDSGMDVLTGVNSGAYPVGELWGYRGEEELLANGAKVIINEPMELISVIKELNS